MPLIFKQAQHFSQSCPVKLVISRRCPPLIASLLRMTRGSQQKAVNQSCEGKAWTICAANKAAVCGAHCQI